MNGQIFSYIFGITSLAIGVGLLWNLFKTKIEDDDKPKWTRNKAIIIPIALILIIRGVYNLVDNNSGRYDIGIKAEMQWAPEDKETLVKACLRDAGQNSTRYPDIMREYCDCSSDIIMSELTYSQYARSLKKTREEQMKLIMPLIQVCYDTMTFKMNREKNAVQN
jgi:hypothetical protein